MSSRLICSTSALLTVGLVMLFPHLQVFAQAKDITKVPGTEGLQIMNVDPGSVYEAMKVESGDLLLEVESRRIRRVQDIEEIFRDFEPGHRVKYKIQHGGQVEEREMEYQKTNSTVTPTPSPLPKKKK